MQCWKAQQKVHKRREAYAFRLFRCPVFSAKSLYLATFVFACPHPFMNAFKENRAVTDAKGYKGGKEEDACHGKAGKGSKNWRTVRKM